jgi:hypothetical protein
VGDRYNYKFLGMPLTPRSKVKGKWTWKAKTAKVTQIEALANAAREERETYVLRVRDLWNDLKRAYYHSRRFASNGIRVC